MDRNPGVFPGSCLFCGNSSSVAPFPTPRVVVLLALYPSALEKVGFFLILNQAGEGGKFFPAERECHPFGRKATSRIIAGVRVVGFASHIRPILSQR